MKRSPDVIWVLVGVLICGTLLTTAVIKESNPEDVANQVRISFSDI